MAVREYLRYGLSYQDVEELLAERGLTLHHVTAYRWVQRFTQEFIEAIRPCRHAPGDRWFVDETYVQIAGQWTYLYQAFDQASATGHGPRGRRPGRRRPHAETRHPAPPSSMTCGR